MRDAQLEQFHGFETAAKRIGDAAPVRDGNRGEQRSVGLGHENRLGERAAFFYRLEALEVGLIAILLGADCDGLGGHGDTLPQAWYQCNMDYF